MNHPIIAQIKAGIIAIAKQRNDAEDRLVLESERVRVLEIYAARLEQAGDMMMHALRSSGPKIVSEPLAKQWTELKGSKP